MHLFCWHREGNWDPDIPVILWTFRGIFIKPWIFLLEFVRRKTWRVMSAIFCQIWICSGIVHFVINGCLCETKTILCLENVFRGQIQLQNYQRPNTFCIKKLLWENTHRLQCFTWGNGCNENGSKEKKRSKEKNGYRLQCILHKKGCSEAMWKNAHWLQIQHFKHFHQLWNVYVNLKSDRFAHHYTENHMSWNEVACHCIRKM